MSEAIPAVELRIADNAHEASAGLLLLTAVLERLRGIVSNALGLENVATGLGRLNESLTNAVPEDSINRLERMAAALERLNNVGGINIAAGGLDAGALDAIDAAANPDAAEGMHEVADAMNAITTAAHIEADAVNVVNTAINNADTSNAHIEDTANNAAGAMTNVADAMQRAAAAGHEAAEGVGNAGRQARQAARHTNNLLRSFARIAQYRALRWVLKQITEGFKEGVENVREYSKAINGHFAAAMDTADNTLLKMKNSIGAAVAPLIEMLIPVLQTVVSWVITAVNWVNQLLALLNGQASWTKAVDASAASLQNVKKNAAGAGKQIKNLLADWDELNIIQSQGGGGGGSSGLINGDAYKKMFTEVYDFDRKLQRAVKFLKQYMQEILDMVLLAGIAIASWRIGSGLEGFMQNLYGLIGAGAIIAIEFQLSSIFTDKYLDTGKPGWLIADAISTAVGTGLAGTLARRFIGGNAMAWTIPLSLTVSAVAGIRTLLGKKDVSALSEKSVTTAILNAAKIGTAVGYGLFHLASFSAATSLIAGAGAALLTFGAVIGIKAIAYAVENDAFSSEEYVASKVAASITMGAGGALVAYATNLSMLGSIEALGAGGALVTFGVMTGIQAIAEARKSQETRSSIGKMALASIETAIGAGLSVATFFGVTAGVIAGSAIGIGAIAVSLAVTSYLIAADKKAVHWGTLHPPTEAIQEFVDGQMFTVRPKVKLSLIANKVTGIATVKKDIQDAVANLTIPMSNLRFNIDTTATYEDIKKQLYGNSEEGTTGLIGLVKEYAKEHKDLIQASISLIPVIDEEGNDISKDLIKAGNKGWDGVSQWFEKMGNKLGIAMKGGIVEGYEGTAEEVVQKITQEISDAALALTQSQASGKMYGYMIDNLGQLDSGAFNEAVEIYKKAVEEQTAEYRGTYLETLESYYALADFYERTGNKKMADEMKAAAERYKANMDSSIASAQAGFEATGKKLLHEWLVEYANGGFTFEGWGANKGFGNMVVEEFRSNGNDFKRALQAVIESEFGVPVNVLDLLDISGWNLLSGEVKENVIKAFEENGGYVPEDVKALLDSNAWDTYNEMLDKKYEEFMSRPNAKVTEFKTNVESLNEIDVTMKGLDTTELDKDIDTTTGKLINLYEAYRNVAALAGMSISSWIGRGKRINPGVNILPFANGGFPSTGQAFIARESGPELVGTINGKTAVANNDQIVAGVANGVAAGQAEQNGLLRQQNEYLRALLNKESTVHVEPSSAWGKFNRRSEAMYARNAGY